MRRRPPRSTRTDTLVPYTTLFRSREVLEAAPLAFRTRIVDHDSKRIHLLHRMFHATAGYLAATNELMCLHVDLTRRRAATLPEAAVPRIRDLAGRHARSEERRGGKECVRTCRSRWSPYH